MVQASPFAPITLGRQTITERLFQGLAHRPGEVVLIDGPSGRSLTAGALMDGIKALAGGLAARGYGKGSTVALMAPNIPEYCTVFHGVAWAGGTVTTVNPTYTAQEVRQQLEDSGADLLVTVPAFLDTAREAARGTRVREIAVIGEAPEATPLAALMGPPLERQAPVDPETDVVALPYSSGTTGLPKGVMLSHRNLVVNVDQCLGVVDIRPGEMTVAFLPFFHIYGMTVMMNMFLAAGGGLVTMPRFDLESFLALSEAHRVRQLYVVPPVVLALAKHPLVASHDLSSLEMVLSGAAPLGADLARACASRLGCPVVQGYGMTELSPVSHFTARSRSRPGTSGQPVANTECRIVDPETGADLPAGIEGELWIRGPQVMLGYLGNPGATEATLTPDGWLKTGDLASVDGEGFLTLHDRVKELIKVKGFQVAPAELEAALTSHPGIADAAVIGRPDAEAGERPVAFVVPAEPGTLSAEEVRAHVAGGLSSYKHLAEVHFVEAIPKSASGKILRRMLREPLAG